MLVIPERLRNDITLFTTTVEVTIYDGLFWSLPAGFQ